MNNINNIGHPICLPHKSSSTFSQEINKRFQAKINKQKLNVPYQNIYIRVTTSTTFDFLTLKSKWSPQLPESPFHSIHIRLRMPTVHLTVHCLPFADYLVLLWLVLRVLVLEIHVSRLSMAISSTAFVKEPIVKLVNSDPNMFWFTNMCLYRAWCNWLCHHFKGIKLCIAYATQVMTM